MFRIESEIDIMTSADVVWRVLTDMKAYPAWNSQLRFLGGEVAVGKHLHLRLDPEGGNGYTFKPEIILLEENTEFAWLGKTGMKGIFDGEHHFVLKEKDGVTTLTNYEIYSGLLSPLFKRLPMMKEAPAGFQLLNKEIKQRAESLAKSGN